MGIQCLRRRMFGYSVHVVSSRDGWEQRKAWVCLIVNVFICTASIWTSIVYWLSPWVYKAMSEVYNTELSYIVAFAVLSYTVWCSPALNVVLYSADTPYSDSQYAVVVFWSLCRWVLSFACLVPLVGEGVLFIFWSQGVTMQIVTILWARQHTIGWDSRAFVLVGIVLVAEVTAAERLFIESLIHQTWNTHWHIPWIQSAVLGVTGPLWVLVQCLRLADPQRRHKIPFAVQAEEDFLGPLHWLVCECFYTPVVKIP
jgi:hypothetical protein